MWDVLYLPLFAVLFYKCWGTFMLSRICLSYPMGDVMAEVSVMCRTAHLVGDRGGASCEVVEQYGCVFKAGVATHRCKLSMWDWMSLLTQLCGSILKGMRVPRASRVEGVFATKHVPLGISRGSVGKRRLCAPILPRTLRREENPQGRGGFCSYVPLDLHSMYCVVCDGPWLWLLKSSGLFLRKPPYTI